MFQLDMVLMNYLVDKFLQVGGFLSRRIMLLGVLLDLDHQLLVRCSRMFLLHGCFQNVYLLLGHADQC